MESVEEFHVSGAANQPIQLPIKAGPVTGHSWTLDLPAGVVQIQDAPGAPVSPLEKLGASVSGNLQVTAAPGDYTIVARLARPWEQGQAVRTARIHLQVR